MSERTERIAVAAPTGERLRAVVFDRLDEGAVARIGRLEADVVVDCGPAGEMGFVPTRSAWDALRAADGERHHVSTVRLRAPVRPAKIIGIAVNYREHAEETGSEVPNEPVVFAKFPSSVVGPGEPIVVPREETRPDYEGELAVVIGQPVHRASRAAAACAIGAITALNDVSGRRAQLETPLRQFTLAKSYDTFTPIGPCLVEPTGLDLAGLDLTTTLNGEVVQSASTGEMIHSVVDLIEYLSRGVTLAPGDVIATGTPAGVGNRRHPPRYLREGDAVEVSVSHVGTLRNQVTIET
jgi:acylpyruvate hydrolase